MIYPAKVKRSRTGLGPSQPIQTMRSLLPMATTHPFGLFMTAFILR